MARASAFLGDPARKELVLSGAATPASPDDIWWPVAVDPAAIGAFCDSNGLDPAFFHFLRTFLGPKGEGDVSQALVDALAALPLGADTRAAFKGWLLWLWDGRGEDSLKTVLSGSDAFAPASDLIKLHQLDEGASATRQQWRQARSALVEVKGLSSEQTTAANVVAAMGWDFGTTPGAAADLVQTCFSELSERVREAFGWVEADSELVRARVIRLHGLAHTELGDPPADRSNREAMMPYMEAFQAIVAREESEAEAQIMKRMQELGAVQSEKSGKLQAELREGLFHQVRIAPVVETAAA